jgi:uncharacterized protein (TIGR03437 family)
MKLVNASFIALAMATTLIAQADRITSPIDPATMVAMRGQVPSRAQSWNDSGLADPSLELEYMTLLVKPSPVQQSNLDQLLASQREPGSQNYRRWLQPEEFADRFGLSRSDVAKIRGWLESAGFTIHDVARGRHWITFSGSAAQVSRAFETEIHLYTVGGQTYYSNSVSPSVPVALSGTVAGIRGLDNFPMRQRPPAHPLPKDNIGGNHYLAPDDLATIYDIKPLYAAGIDGTGQTIAIAGETDIDLSDIRAFRQRFNLPPNDPKIVTYGKDPGPVTAEQGEANLDLEWSGAVAPGATINFVNSTNVFTSAQYAIDQDLAPVLSISYGFCEAGLESLAPAFRTVAQQANAQGITWIAAAGDNGAAGCDVFGERQATLGYAVGFPAALPEVTSLGGAQLNDSGGTYWSVANNANGGSALGYIPEAVWNPGGSVIGGGGGASILFAKPEWQAGPGVPNDGARDVPDVVLTAAPNPDGYVVILGGRLAIVGGTSASAPSFAGIVALLNHYLVANGAQAPGVGNINPMLYRLAQNAPSGFHDVVDGSNTVPCEQSSPGCVDGSLGWPATAGYDLASGLGSVDAYNLVTQWTAGAGASSATALTTSAPSLPQDGAVTLSAVVTALTGVGVPSGSVSFHAGDTPIATAALDASSGTPTATVAAYGSQLPVGDGTITATYLGDTTFGGSSASVPIEVDVPPGASAVAPSITPNPIYQVGSSWPYTIRLTETAGVATTLTDFTVNGVTYASSIMRDFGSAAIPANGSIAARLILTGLTVPATATFGFSGMDASGQTWTQQFPVAVYGSPLGDSISYSLAPTTVNQNLNADPSCQWSNVFNLNELSGFPLQITKVMAGGADLSAQIPQIFGSSRIAPFGVARGAICWNGITPPATASLVVNASILEDGGSYKISVSSSFRGPPANPATLNVSSGPVTLTPDASGNASAPVAIDFGGAAIAWAVSLSPNNLTTNWLSVSPASGAGAGSFSINASAGALSPGVYKGTVVVNAPNAFPSTVDVPVMLVVGGSATASISGIANAASGQGQAAPGMMMTVYGTNLAPGTQSTMASPLPLIMQGVSATINGVSAPIFSVSPGQLTIQAPYEVGAGMAALGVNNNGQIASYLFPVTPAAPGIFTDSNGNLAPTASGQAGQTISLYITGEGDIDTLLATGTTPASGTATSELPNPSQPVMVTVGGVQAATTFVGITHGLIGETEVSFTIPAGLGAGPQAVVVTVGGVASPPANLNVLQ